MRWVAHQSLSAPYGVLRNREALDCMHTWFRERDVGRPDSMVTTAPPSAGHTPWFVGSGLGAYNLPDLTHR